MKLSFIIHLDSISFDSWMKHSMTFLEKMIRIDTENQFIWVTFTNEAITFWINTFQSENLIRRYHTFEQFIDKFRSSNEVELWIWNQKTSSTEIRFDVQIRCECVKKSMKNSCRPRISYSLWIRKRGNAITNQYQIHIIYLWLLPFTRWWLRLWLSIVFGECVCEPSFCVATTVRYG